MKFQEVVKKKTKKELQEHIFFDQEEELWRL